MPESLRILPKREAETKRLSSKGVERIEGYAARFFNRLERGTEYHLGGKVYERLRPGCFDRAIREKHDVRCLFNHGSDNLLARTVNGTCKLSVDDKGLRYSFLVDFTDPDHQRVLAKIDRGDLSGSSFAFQPLKVDWEILPDGRQIRWVADVMLVDVGPVSYPAYSATTAKVARDENLLEAARAALKASNPRTCDWRRRLHRLWELEYLVSG